MLERSHSLVELPNFASKLTGEYLFLLQILALFVGRDWHRIDIDFVQLLERRSLYFFRGTDFIVSLRLLVSNFD